jgi:SulP family sulfate permease
MNDERPAATYPPRGLARWLPGLAALRDYPRAALAGDFAAGIAACVVMIPSVLAYAELIGVPPVVGLYTALAAMAGYALFAARTPVFVGPDATVALLAAAAVVPLAAGDPARTAALAVALALLVGIALIIAARLSAGALADLLSKPVLVGYLNGAALVLIGTQLHKLLGIPLSHDAFVPRIVEATSKLGLAHGPTLALGAALIALLLVLRRALPWLPGALVACIVATIAARALDLPARGVALLGAVPRGLPAPTLPSLSLADIAALVPGALATAFLVFAEGVLLVRAVAARIGTTVDANRELNALGFANVAAAAMGGFTVGASNSRTVTAVAAGGRTPLAQWIAAGLLLAFVLWLAPLLSQVPTVALAAILIHAGIMLVDLPGVRELGRQDRAALRVCLAVTAGVVAFGVLPGILVGIVLSVLHVVLDVARPRDAVLRRLSADGRFHDLDDDEPGDSPPGVVVYRLYAPLVFANARHVTERLQALVDGADPPVRCLVLDLRSVPYVDISATDVLLDFHDRMERAGVDVRIARANRPLREQLLALTAGRRLSVERFFESASAAVDDFLRLPAGS